VVGFFIVYGMFDGMIDIFEKIALNSDLQKLTTIQHQKSGGEWFWYLLLSALAIFLLPRQFQVSVVENEDEKHIIPAMWIFALYLLVINFLVLPIALGGEIWFGGTSSIFNSDMFMLSLPLASDFKNSIFPTENRLTFKFTAFNYQEGTTVYKTKLWGIDNEWVLSTSPERTFERLPKGQYTFEIDKVTVDKANLETTVYHLTVLPPWYLTRLAYIMYVILFISLVVFFRIYIVLKLKKHIDKVRLEQQFELEKEQRLYHQRIVELENEKLQNEIEFKSHQLAAVTMTTINKNEILSGIRNIINKQMDELGSRFPKKNYFEIIEAIDKQLSDDDWDTFESNFDRAHQNFFNRLKEQFPDLTPGDIKLCAYLKMNLSSKEIAHLLNISIRSVEVHRYRIRKKLYLSPTDNLVEFLMGF